MVIRRGRKKKTAAEKDAELRAVMEKVMRIAAVDTNIKRNIAVLKSNKRDMNKLLKEAKATRNTELKETLKFYSSDYEKSVNKLAGFVKEDVALVRKELEELRPKGRKK